MSGSMRLLGPGCLAEARPDEGRRHEARAQEAESSAPADWLRMRMRVCPSCGRLDQ